VDRRRAYHDIRTGLLFLSLALFFFGASFILSVLYIA
jgi:hypothetical protein